MSRYYTFLFILPFIIGTGCYLETGKARFRSFPVENARNFEVDSFNQISIEGDFSVFLQNGDKSKVQVNGSDDLLDLVHIEVADEVLRIRYFDKYMPSSKQSSSLAVNIIASHSITKISGRESVALTIPSKAGFQFEDLILDFAGVLNLRGAFYGNSLHGCFAGATHAKLFGHVNSFSVDMPGAGKLNSLEMEANIVNLHLSGAAKADVHATEELHVKMSGACSVSYTGNPDELFSNISGIGRIRSLDSP